mgnify:FL=1
MTGGWLPCKRRTVATASPDSSPSSTDSEGASETRIWAEVRKRALIRSTAAAILALVAIVLPIVQPIGHFVCDDKEEELPDSDIMFASWISVLTSVISIACLGLVLSSQMKWWLSSPFLSRVRWHVLLDSVNVWLFHFLATHPSCGLDYHAASGMTTLSLFSTLCHIFFWFNKLMGFTIIKTHLTMLERAFERSLGSRFLDYLFFIFGISIAVATVAFLGDRAAPQVQELKYVVIVIEVGVVLSCLSVAVLMTRAFWLAHRYAKMEALEAQKPVERELAMKAVHFSKRMRWEAPLNLLLVGTAFAFHVFWLFELNRPGQENRPAVQELGFLLAAILSLSNCARFAALLSLVEFTLPQKQSIFRQMSKTFFRSISNASSDMEDMTQWKTGHAAWDEKTEELAHRAVTLRALLDFYSSLPQKMPHFDPAKHKTSDIVRQVIIPMSRDSHYGDSSAAVLMMEGRRLLPDRMVTHSWSNHFACLIASVVGDALELPSYSSVLNRLKGQEMLALKSELYWKNKLDTAYWICCFSIDQHAGICAHVPAYLRDPVTDEVPKACSCQHPKYWSFSEPLKDGQSVKCEMNKFDNMMDCIFSLNPSCSQLIAVDVEFQLFTRAWCVAEIHQAQMMHMPMRMIILSEENLKRQEAWLHHLKVQEMKASNPSDVKFILSKIDDPRQFDAELQQLIFGTGGLVQCCHMGFERVSLLGAVAQRGFDRSRTETMDFVSCLSTG